MIKLTDKNKPLSSENLLVAPRVFSTKPFVSIEFLDRMPQCLASMCSKYRKRPTDLYDNMSLFQSFVSTFSKMDSLQAAQRYFGSSNGTKMYAKDSIFVKNLINKFTELNADSASYVSDNLWHYHLKPGGKGKAVAFGFTYENIFYVLSVDPEHEFQK